MTTLATEQNVLIPLDKTGKLAVVLVEPRIPQNFGAIARLCACTGSDLLLIGDIGFNLDEKEAKRSGMDYFEHVKITQYADLPEVFKDYPNWDVALLSSYGKQSHTQMAFKANTLLVFGSEDKGLPKSLINKYPEKTFRIPMVEGRRSLNLATSVAVVLYESLSQLEAF